MTTAARHPLVEDYLARLRPGPRRLPVDQARELMADIDEHLRAALPQDASEAEVRNALDRLGTPRELVTEAGRTPTPASPTERQIFRLPGRRDHLPGRRRDPVSLLLPLSVPLWIVGLVMMARATVWTEREKWLGFLGLGRASWSPWPSWSGPRHQVRLRAAARRSSTDGVLVQDTCSGVDPVDDRRLDADARLPRTPGLHGLAAGPAAAAATAMSGPISRSALPRCEIASFSSGVSSAVVTPGRSSASNTTS